ncbi:MAG: tripartite ATP-independent periplasmic transporter solute receptor, DctP family [Oscillospiraceae bacterium]|nr:tripartite ATP-independent periplasmic transporter solute receptor, DctP family [Oscillospiraceae bacterium]
MKKRILSLVFSCALVFSMTACGQSASSAPQGSTSGSSASGEVVTLKLAMVDNESTPYYKGAMKIAEEVSAATNGRIQIEVVPGGTLGGERDTVELAMNGDLDIATAANSVLTNWIPEMSILDQAYLWENADQAHAAVDGKVGELINKKAEALGLHVIGYMESGFRDVFSTTPIEKPSDFTGIKIRTMQNQYHMAAFESFGAMPTPMSFNEVFTALQQGSINAAENAVSGCLTNGYYEVTKNVTTTHHAFVYILLCMSDKAWNKIPADLQQPFLDAVKRGYEAQRDYLVEFNNDSIEQLKAKGVTFHEIDTAALKTMYDEAAKAKSFTFNSDWEAACKEAIEANPSK